jgi:putative Flp pilus-assembly TadE/G-like protein
MKLFANERGQATVLTVLSLTVLLGMAALVLDVGSWFRAQRDTQAAADASALAAAQALPDAPGSASVLAGEYVDKNGGGARTITFSTKNVANDTVSVRVERPTPGFFAKVFGINSVQVAGKATARAGTLGQARFAAPIGVDKRHPLLGGSGCPCFGQDTDLELEKVGPGAFRFLNLDGSHGGTGTQDIEAWITQGFDGYMPLGWYGSNPGAKTSSNVTSAMNVKIGDELLFPVYDRTVDNGANFYYEVIGWVGFLVTDYIKVGGNNKRITGQFVRVIWEGIQSTSSSAISFGAQAIQLVE